FGLGQAGNNSKSSICGRAMLPEQACLKRLDVRPPHHTRYFSSSDSVFESHARKRSNERRKNIEHGFFGRPAHGTPRLPLYCFDITLGASSTYVNIAIP